MGMVDLPVPPEFGNLEWRASFVDHRAMSNNLPKKTTRKLSFSFNLQFAKRELIVSSDPKRLPAIYSDLR